MEISLAPQARLQGRFEVTSVAGLPPSGLGGFDFSEPRGNKGVVNLDAAGVIEVALPVLANAFRPAQVRAALNLCAASGEVLENLLRQHATREASASVGHKECGIHRAGLGEPLKLRENIHSRKFDPVNRPIAAVIFYYHKSSLAPAGAFGSGALLYWPIPQGEFALLPWGTVAPGSIYAHAW